LIRQAVVSPAVGIRAGVLRESLTIAWPELGISIDNVTPKGEDEGVNKFNQPFEKLVKTLVPRSPWQLTSEL
jgi:hypothetical protein